MLIGKVDAVESSRSAVEVRHVEGRKERARYSGDSSGHARSWMIACANADEPEWQGAERRRGRGSSSRHRCMRRWGSRALGREAESSKKSSRKGSGTERQILTVTSPGYRRVNDSPYLSDPRRRGPAGPQ
eukprot:758377-Hanusia_phi.AAC.1